jgi:uncharacterized protein (TIGR03067 family)
MHPQDGAPAAAGDKIQAKQQIGTIVSRHAAAVHDLIQKVHKKFDKSATPAPAPDDKEKNKSDTADADGKKLKGKWKVVSLAVDGMKQDEVPNHRLTFADGTFVLEIDGQERANGTYRLDAAAKPKVLDLVFTEGIHAGDTMPGIFEWDGDRLKLCAGAPKGDRPKDFNSPDGSGHRLMVFEKE